LEDLASYLYEVGLLKRIRRSGWWVAGVDDPESVAEHAFRTAVLGFLLAGMEGADPLRTAAICLFHDTPEARTGDLHRINHRYLKAGEAERTAARDQWTRLPAPMGEHVAGLMREWLDGESMEARVARDADNLECLIQAREYQAQGCSSVVDWINNAFGRLQTESARQLARACMEQDPKKWWHDLKVRPR
jgi:putative hydrolase of HD superfamily